MAHLVEQKEFYLRVDVIQNQDFARSTPNDIVSIMLIFDGPGFSRPVTITSEGERQSRFWWLSSSALAHNKTPMFFSVPQQRR